MGVLATCKNEEDPLKNEGTKVVTKIFHVSICRFFLRSRAANSIVQGLLWPKFKPFQDFIGGLVDCKNEENPIKMKALKWSQNYSLIFQTLKGS